MKNTIIKTGISLFVISLFVFSSCTKTNVRRGNKRIIGTWELSSQKSISQGSGNSNYTFTTNTCGYDNSSSSYTYMDSVMIEGTTVHEYYSNSNTSSGVTTDDTGDTTYTQDDTSWMTFNEDGTCKMKETSKDTDDNGYPDNYDSEYTGYWSWIDSYKEKSGIVIDLVNMSKSYGGSRTMRLYIKTLDKEQLVFSYTTTYTSSGEYTSFWDYCSDDGTDVYRTRKSDDTGTESGEKYYSKQ
ncbi:MAG: hypothetical protein GXO80_13215 [Chlorobi bacterium]|nr:hypothetical protein [Chlorobiota bacterium]